MKKNLLPLLLCFSCFANAENPYKKNFPNAVLDSPKVALEKVWVDYDVKEDNLFGMRVHVKCRVYNMKDIPGYVAIYFNERGGKALVASDKKYSSKKGEVAVYKSIKPGYDEAVYNDFVLFIPYDAFNLSTGKYLLQMDIDVIYENGDLVKHLTYYDFDYEKKQPANNITSPGASLQKIWVEHNVWKDNVQGMKIFLNYTIYEMKDREVYLSIYFKNKNGTYLKDKNKKYYSTSGEVAVHEIITPKYAASEFKNFDLFIPYDELEFSEPGRYELQMDVHAINNDLNVNKKLTTYDFSYTKPVNSGGVGAAGGGPSSNINAVINVAYKDSWIEYDVYEDGKKGIRFHAKFTVSYMKDREGYLAVYFFKKDGSKLYSNNTSYRSTSGQLASFKKFIPAYEASEFSDLSTFMPYEEIALPAGRYDLSVEINLIYKEGGIIKSLAKKEFWVQK